MEGMAKCQEECACSIACSAGEGENKVGSLKAGLSRGQPGERAAALWVRWLNLEADFSGWGFGLASPAASPSTCHRRQLHMPCHPPLWYLYQPPLEGPALQKYMYAARAVDCSHSQP